MTPPELNSIVYLRDDSRGGHAFILTILNPRLGTMTAVHAVDKILRIPGVWLGYCQRTEPSIPVVNVFTSSITMESTARLYYHRTRPACKYC